MFNENENQTPREQTNKFEHHDVCPPGPRKGEGPGENMERWQKLINAELVKRAVAQTANASTSAGSGSAQTKGEAAAPHTTTEKTGGWAASTPRSTSSHLK